MVSGDHWWAIDGPLLTIGSATRKFASQYRSDAKAEAKQKLKHILMPNRHQCMQSINIKPTPPYNYPYSSRPRFPISLMRDGRPMMDHVSPAAKTGTFRKPSVNARFRLGWERILRQVTRCRTCILTS